MINEKNKIVLHFRWAVFVFSLLIGFIPSVVSAVEDVTNETLNDPHALAILEAARFPPGAYRRLFVEVFGPI